MKAESPIEYALRFLLVLAAWTCLGLFGMLCYSYFGGVAPVWPASGVGIAALVLWGRRYWPAISLGGVILGLSSAMQPQVYLVFSLGNTLEALAAAWVLERLGFQPTLSRARDAMLLALAAAPACAISAGLGVSALLAGHYVTWHNWMAKGSSWVFGDFLGVVLVAPLILAWSAPVRERLSLRRIIEAVLLAAGIALACVMMFFQPAEAASSRAPLAFLTFPFVAIAGIRFGLRGGTLATLLVAALSVTATALHLGVFVAQDLRDSTALLMMFEGMLALTALFVAAATAEHRRQARDLRLNEQLFEGLAEANRLLLASPSWEQAAPQVLETLGRAARTDRAALYRNDRTNAAGPIRADVVQRWCAPGMPVSDPGALLTEFDYTAHGMNAWLERFEQGLPQAVTRSELNAAEEAILASQGIQSVLFAPIMIEGRCWGLIALADCRRERRWTHHEMGVLQAIATNFGIAVRRDQLRKERDASIARHRALLSAMPDAYFLHDRAGRFLDYHLNDPKILWKQPAEFLGRTHHEVFPPDVAAQIEQGFAKVAATGKPVVLQYSLQTPTGVRHYERRLVRAEGDMFLAIVREVTEQRQADLERERMERKMREMQKLESLGVLAGGIAHDFNNLLTAILGNASLARLTLAPGAEATPLLGQIESASHRAADLCRQMLAYAGRGQFVIDTADLTQLIQDTVPLLHLSVSKRADLGLDLSEQPLPVLVDATQVRQILMNLVMNAAEAMGEGGGRIVVRSGTMFADAAYLATARSAHEAEPGEYYFMEVADNGSGMDPETLARIFDPFFTTKFTGRGLGLASVLGIVQGHHGVLGVTSSPGSGSTFRVLFPPARNARTAIEAKPPSARPFAPAANGHGLVLVVDDELPVRLTACGILERMGYQTAAAADGAQAVTEFAARPDDFEAVLLDLTMPGMDGSQTLTELQKIRPAVPVLFMSGYSEQELTQRMKGRGVRGFLPKPFTADTLQERMALVRR